MAKILTAHQFSRLPQVNNFFALQLHVTIYFKQTVKLKFRSNRDEYEQPFNLDGNFEWK